MLSSVFQTARALQLTGLGQVAATLIIIYDHVLTFDDEIRIMWGGKFSTVTFFYFVNRYIGGGVMIVNILLSFHTSFSVTTCKVLDLVTVFGPFVCVWSNQVIMLIRLWVMYNNSKKILMLTLGLLAAEIAGIMAALFVWLHSVTYTNLPLGPAFYPVWRMCAFSSTGTLLTAIYVPIFCYELIMFSLALFAVFKRLGGIKREWKTTSIGLTVNMLLKYSIVYFVLYFAGCAIATGMYFGLHSEYLNITNAFLMAYSIIFCGRFVLSARNFSHTGEGSNVY